MSERSAVGTGAAPSSDGGGAFFFFCCRVERRPNPHSESDRRDDDFELHGFEPEGTESMGAEPAGTESL